MPDIYLRAYGREIDELIERERLEEAIAHCRYILQTYPKHLETYRLLGKAYLEAKRYGDAADIFQRVLSAVPDDFVSHVGMAIVREDEGNLDAAIWHMERAFETNPSNPAIQQEMKRLISRRDGLEPHKVRLTRGALARMYAHGELFAQAIAELRSALQEDPERPDLQVLLASMYWQTDQRIDATSVSNQILEKLPYCAEANRILAANLQARDRTEEAAVYHRRLASLDPYASFVESALADSSGIEESAVSLERLDWAAGEPLPSAAPGQPGWAATLGMEMQEPSEDLPEKAEPPQTGPLPSWLEPGEPPPFEAAAEKELREEMETQAEDGSEDVAGAGFLEELEAETPYEADIFEPESEEEDAGPGALGVAAATAGIAAGELAGEDEDESEELIEAEPEVPPMGEAAVAGGMFAEPQGVEPSEGELDTSDEETLIDDHLQAEGAEPSGEAEAAGEYVESAELEEAADSEIPDWMQEAGWTESSGEVEETPISFSDQEMDALDAGQIPDDIPEDEDAELTPAELPDWIHDIAPEEIEGSSDGAGDESLPGWIGAEASSEGEEPAGDVIAPSAELDAAGENGEGEASFPAAEPDTSELPTWITEEPPGATETIVTWLEDRGPDSVEEETAEGEDLPDWMRDTGQLEETLGPGSIEAEEDTAPPPGPPLEEPVTEVSEDPSAEGPPSESWLSAVAAAAAEEEAEPASSEDEGAETPVMLPEADAAPEESAPGGIEHGLGIAAAAAVGMLAGEEEDEARPPESADALDQDQEAAAISLDAEVESAAEAEAPSPAEDIEIFEEEAPAKAETPVEEAPSFTAEAEISEEETPSFAAEAGVSTEEAPSIAAEAEISEEETPSFAAEAEAIDQPEVSGAPDWLKEIGTLPQQPVGEDSADWLEGLEIDSGEAPAEPAGETPDWLKGLAEEGADAEASGATPAPDWLREISEPGSVSQEAEAVDAEPEEEVAEQPAEEAAEEPVLEGSGGSPDWLQGIGAGVDEEAPGDSEEAAAAVEPRPEPEAPMVEEDDEVMDWLEDLAAKQAEAPDEEELEAGAKVEAAAPVLEERDIPDEPEGGLEWLEQLADQRGIDVDVSLPGQEAPATTEPEPEPDHEPDTTPAWLGRMATKPLPKIDLEAPEAAIEGEEVRPDAETIQAQAAEVQAQLEEAALERDAEEEGFSEVAPSDITIEARSSDLQAEMEAPERGAEPIPQPEDEIPDWLISAAEQAEAPTGALPEEFAGEPEPEDEDRLAEPALAEKQEFPTETVEPPGPEAVDELVADMGVSEVEELEEVQRVAAVETEEEVVEQLETEELVAAEPLEAEEFETPGPAEELVTDEAAPVVEAEPTSEQAPSLETKKKEDLLERSRQALASGDTQAAVAIYGDMVKRKQSLESVIEDLRIAVDRTPDNADLWQVLGDAYMRDDQLDEAIDAYRKGMEAA